MDLTRREAIKKMGVMAVGMAMGSNMLATAGELSSRNKKRMKILAINGSARNQGNTSDMINVVLSELSNEGYEIEKVDLVDKTINPCRA